MEAGAEAGGVLMRDGEDSVAALGAAGPADEVRPAAKGGGSQGGVNDLDEVGHEVSGCRLGEVPGVLPPPIP